MQVATLRIVVLICVACVVGCEKTQPRVGLIVGNSMAPHALGEHVFVTCPSCRLGFASSFPTRETSTFVCPNCGTSGIPQNEELLRPAQQFNINPSKAIDRWSMVAFRTGFPDRPVGIKRVVGLPGETITIEDGNVFANGTILRKSLETQKHLRILVHDSRFQSSEDRWVDVMKEDQDGDIKTREITYRHKRCFLIPKGKPHESEVAPIQDSYGFNQFLPRKLNDTSELFVEMSVKNQSDLKFQWNYESGKEQAIFRLDAQTKQLFVSIEDHKQQNATREEYIQLPPEIFAGNEIVVEFSSFDRQLIAAVNCRVVFEFELQSNLEEGFNVSLKPISIVPMKGEFELNRVRLWRDIHYLDSERGSLEMDGKKGFILFGDNVPISIDSRSWETPDVQPQDILGVIELP